MVILTMADTAMADTAMADTAMAAMAAMTKDILDEEELGHDNIYLKEEFQDDGGDGSDMDEDELQQQLMASVRRTCSLARKCVKQLKKMKTKKEEARAEGPPNKKDDDEPDDDEPDDDAPGEEEPHDGQHDPDPGRQEEEGPTLQNRMTDSTTLTLSPKKQKGPTPPTSAPPVHLLIQARAGRPQKIPPRLRVIGSRHATVR